MDVKTQNRKTELPDLVMFAGHAILQPALIFSNLSLKVSVKFYMSFGKLS